MNNTYIHIYIYIYIFIYGWLVSWDRWGLTWIVVNIKC